MIAQTIFLSLVVSLATAYNESFVYRDLLEEPKYQLSISNLKSLDESLEAPQLFMRSHDGVKYLCLITNEADSNTISETSKNTKLDKQAILQRGLELLEPLKTSCLYTTEGWWTYEYCHLSHIRQYRKVLDHESTTYKSEDGFFLGRYGDKNSEHTQKFAVTTLVEGSRNHLSQRWGGGSMCDITRRPRTVEIQVSL
ncbi:Protein OS-9, variant 2 [Basidiobolus ranarum]|uniref:Protein OS-9 homolog n=1 Tax=Basidiobolus ranarum TaxID=34480 RepID=A0ABR2WHW6_9FUNG